MHLVLRYGEPLDTHDEWDAWPRPASERTLANKEQAISHAASSMSCPSTLIPFTSR